MKNIKIPTLVICLILLLSNNIELSAQLEASSIYNFNLVKSNGQIDIKRGKFLSNFNPNGYNNQVTFISADNILLAANIDDPAITDLYKANIRLGKLERITANGLADYSPAIVPGIDYYSCVRVEEDGSTQLLWLYPTDGSNVGFTPLPDITNIGYYAWINADLVALFLVDAPNKLSIANIKTGESSVILENIGRCLKLDSDGNLIFVHKISADQWYLKSYNPSNQKMDVICQTLPGKEDFELSSNDNILMGDKSKLYEFNQELTNSWVELFDFRKFGIKKISRLALRNNKLILIENE